MSSGMNTEQAKEYAKTMTYREAVSNIKHGKGIKYRKATMIKLRELAEIADRLDRKTENSSEKPNNCDEPQYDFGEYADRLWKIAYERGKREALEQTEPSCDTCKLKDTTEWCKRQEVCRAYQPKTEPQTERSSE